MGGSGFKKDVQNSRTLIADQFGSFLMLFYLPYVYYTLMCENSDSVKVCF